MQPHQSRPIAAFLLVSALLLLVVGCGSENSVPDTPHSAEHMDSHATEHMDGHTSHEELSHMESSTGGHDHDGTHDASGAIMEKPDDARLVTITATDYEFSPAEISAEPGEKLFVKLINKGNAVHMWQLKGMPETHVHTLVGETSGKTVVAPRQPGEYKIFCGTAGHEDLGMVGTLTVRSGHDTHEDSSIDNHAH